MLTVKLVVSSAFYLHVARKLLWRGIRSFVCLFVEDLWHLLDPNAICIHQCFYISNVLGSFIVEVWFFSRMERLWR